MADRTPAGAALSFAGTAIQGGTNVASVGYPNITKVPTEAYMLTLGQTTPVDLLNGQVAPRKVTITVPVLVRAADSITDPVAAYGAVVAGYRALESMPETGTLIIDSGGGLGIASCQARRKPIDLPLTHSNARMLVCLLVFTPTTDWI